MKFPNQVFSANFDTKLLLDAIFFASYLTHIYTKFKKFNVDERTVKEALTGGDPHNQYVIAYHLIIDNRRISEGILLILRELQLNIF